MTSIQIFAFYVMPVLIGAGGLLYAWSFTRHMRNIKSHDRVR